MQYIRIVSPQNRLKCRIVTYGEKKGKKIKKFCTWEREKLKKYFIVTMSGLCEGGLAKSLARTWPSPRQRWRRWPMHSSDFTGYESRGLIRSRCCSLLLGVVQFLAQFRCSFCESGNRRRNRHPVTSVNMSCFIHVYVYRGVWWASLAVPEQRGIKAENHPSFSIIRITNSQDRTKYRSTEQQWPSRYCIQFFKSAWRKLTRVSRK